MLVTTPASAFTEFIQKPMKAGFQVKGVAQSFTINTGVEAAAIECGEVKGSGGSEVEKFNRVAVQVKYEKCKAFASPAVISAAQYKFSATGTLSVGNSILIKVPGAGGCEIEVGPSGNENLSTITYENTKPAGEVVLKSAVKGIAYTVLNKGSCAKEDSKFNNGEYKGVAEAKRQRPTTYDCVYRFFPLPWYEWEDSQCTRRNTNGFQHYTMILACEFLELI